MIPATRCADRLRLLALSRVLGDDAPAAPTPSPASCGAPPEQLQRELHHARLSGGTRRWLRIGHGRKRYHEPVNDDAVTVRCSRSRILERRRDVRSSSTRFTPEPRPQPGRRWPRRGLPWRRSAGGRRWCWTSRWGRRQRRAGWRCPRRMWRTTAPVAYSLRRPALAKGGFDGVRIGWERGLSLPPRPPTQDGRAQSQARRAPGGNRRALSAGTRSVRPVGYSWQRSALPAAGAARRLVIGFGQPTIGERPGRRATRQCTGGTVQHRQRAGRGWLSGFGSHASRKCPALRFARTVNKAAGLP